MRVGGDLGLCKTMKLTHVYVSLLIGRVQWWISLSLPHTHTHPFSHTHEQKYSPGSLERALVTAHKGL